MGQKIVVMVLLILLSFHGNAALPGAPHAYTPPHSHLTINSLNDTTDVNPYLLSIEDPNHQYTLEDIQSGKYNHLWQRNQEPYFIGHNHWSKYWFKLDITWDGENTETGVIYIDAQPILLSQIAVTTSNSNQTSTPIITGVRYPYASREVASPQYGFKVPLTPRQTTSIIGWVDNTENVTPALLAMKFTSVENYRVVQTDFHYLLVAFYSIMAALLFYNLCLFLTLREKVYGLYLAFLAGATLFCLNTDGTSHRWLWPENPYLYHRVTDAIGIFTAMIYLAFINAALDGVKFWPRFENIYRGLIALGLLSIAITFWPIDQALSSLLLQAYPPLMIPVTLTLIISAIRKKIPTSFYLMLAEIMTISGAGSFMLMINGLIELNSLTMWSLHLGFLAESLLLSLAVAARTNIIIQEKLRAQEMAYDNEAKAFAALETATQTKNQFLTTISHELRTPLNSIIGFSNVMLDDDKITGAHRDHTKTILNNGKQLLTVINDVLNLSLIDSGRLSLTSRKIDLDNLIHGLEVRYRLKAQKNQLSFDINCEQTLPKEIEIDDEHFLQVLKQLLDNAFKFTHQGFIQLDITTNKREVNDGKTGHLILTLKDTGIGIAPEKIPTLFKPFTQVDSSNARSYSGTGVGLFIAKSVTEKMGGSLSVESTEGIGSLFELKIPYKIVQEEMPQAAETQTSTNTTKFEKSNLPLRLKGKVLYAEDNRDNQRLVKLLVEKTGAKITVVENGQEALEKIKDDCTFDLLLMDLQMPIMDGYEATSVLKQEGFASPIVACSASALAEIESSSDIDFEGYLGKPIVKSKLYNLLQEYLPLSDA